MHLAAQLHEGWPTVNFAIQRTWDSWPNVSWSDINPAAGSYDWSQLDALVADSRAHGVDLVYTFGYVPRWASTNPNGDCSGGPAGSCYAPTQQAWRDFVTQITYRYGDQIKYWEVWNEPNAGNFWKGTHAQLVDMARQMQPIVKNAGGTLLAPSPQGNNAHLWLDQYFGAGGAEYADVVNFHGYVHGAPETLATLVTNIRGVMSKHGIADRPLWDTEHSWGDKSWPMGADEDQQAAWLARYQIMSFDLGIERSFWYGWEHFDWGTLFDRNADKVLKPGIAYREVYAWMNGSRFQPCKAEGALRSCALVRADGTEATVLWSTGANVNYTVPTGYVRMRTIEAQSTALGAGQNLSIGMKPVLIEK